MNSFKVYLRSLYIAIGAIFLFVPIIYLELGRPKGLIKFFDFIKWLPINN